MAIKCILNCPRNLYLTGINNKIRELLLYLAHHINLYSLEIFKSALILDVSDHWTVNMNILMRHLKFKPEAVAILRRRALSYSQTERLSLELITNRKSASEKTSISTVGRISPKTPNCSGSVIDNGSEPCFIVTLKNIYKTNQI